jgi:hypothetical protein
VTRPALPLPVARALAAAVLLFAFTAIAHAALDHGRGKPASRAVQLSDLGADAPAAPTSTPAPRLAQVAIPALRDTTVRHRPHRTTSASSATVAATPAPSATPSPATPTATPDTTLTSAAPTPAPAAPAPAPAVNPAPAAQPPTSNRPATPPGQAKQRGPSFDSSG